MNAKSEAINSAVIARRGVSAPVDVLAVFDELQMMACDAHDYSAEAASCAAAARTALVEMTAAIRPLVALTFEEARANEDERIDAVKAGAYPPPEKMWCREDVLNPCWSPSDPYTGKHWGWTPDMEGDGAVCEHCRIRAAIAHAGSAA